MRGEVLKIESVAGYISLLTLYLYAAGAFYLAGYWMPVGINVFDYVDALDIVKASATGVMSAFSLVIFPLASFLFLAPKNKSNTGIEHSKVVVFFIKNIRWAVSIYIILFMLAVLIAQGSRLNLAYSSLLLFLLFGLSLYTVILIYVWLIEYGFIVHLNLYDYLRVGSGLYLLLISMLCFVFGYNKSTDIIYGIRYLYVIDEKESKSVDSKMAMRYFGYNKGGYFFWDPTNDSIVIREDLDFLKLKKFKQ